MTSKELRSTLGFVALLAAFVGFYVLVRGTNRPRPPPVDASALRSQAAPPRTLHVPKAAGLVRDGHLDEPVWTLPGNRTRGFSDATGNEARPYSEARFAHDDSTLWIGLYAADGDIRGPSDERTTGDAFVLTVRVDGVAKGILVRPGGLVPAPGLAPIVAEAAFDADGTVDAPGDEDEEWVAELQVPLASLGAGAEGIDVHVQRLDALDGGDAGRRGRWPATGARAVLVLDP